MPAPPQPLVTRDERNKGYYRWAKRWLKARNDLAPLHLLLPIAFADLVHLIFFGGDHGADYLAYFHNVLMAILVAPNMNNNQGVYDGTANFPGFFVANDWPVFPLRHVPINYRPATVVYPIDDHPSGPTLSDNELEMLFLMLRRIHPRDVVHGGASNLTHPCLQQISPHHGASRIRDFFPDRLPALEDTRTFGCRMQNGKCNMEAYIVAVTVCALHNVDYHGSKIIRTKELVEHVRLFVQNQRWVFNDYMRFWATTVDEEMVDRLVEHVRLFVQNQRWVFNDYMRFWATTVDEEMVDRNEVTIWEAYKKEWDEPEWAEIQVPRVSGRDEWAQAANPHPIQRL